MTQELVGACGCGKVQYKITGPVRVVVNCHCTSCRKRNAAPYSTYCVVAQADVKISQGEASLATYEESERGKKQFCSHCGTPLFNLNKRYPGMCMVFHGTLQEGTAPRPEFNIYCENKLPWVDGISSIKSFTQAIER